MVEKMDRKQVVFGTAAEQKTIDKEYWSKATVKERLQTVTYLREYFYGTEATTGRLQRFYKVFKRA